MKISNKVSVGALLVSLVVGLGPVAVFASGPAVVNLGSAGDFTILAKTGISTTGNTSVVGDIGVSPAAATYITGFGLSLPAASAFSTSPLVSGKVYAPEYASPTPANLTTAVSDMQTAYTDAMSRINPTATELGAGNIGGMTLAPGLYKWGTGVTISSDVTLSGGVDDVWIFQVAQNLDIGSGVKVVLNGGAVARNIFWVVAGQTTLGTTSVFNGNILDQTAIVLNAGATLYGRALAQTAVTLDANSVSVSGVVSSAPVVVATPVVSTTTTSYESDGVVVSVTPDGENGTSSVSALDDTGDSGCLLGNRFSTVTGRNCGVASLAARDTNDAGCFSGNKFSTLTGRSCVSVSARTSSSISFGERVRVIAKNLGKGSRGNEVKDLQEFLVSQNKGPKAQALAGITPTTYFGEMTREALAEFQASVGISPAIGYFGPKTRAYIGSR